MLQRDICLELLKQFPTAGSLTIAKIAYRDNPSVFPSLEAARGAVRVIRGANGKGDIKFAVKEHVRPHRKPGDPFSKIPDAITSLEDWKAVKIEGVKRALVLADIHIPYHDRPALLAALRHGKKAKVDCIIINGDALDVFSLSFWKKDPRERQFKREIDAGREFFVALREAFPKARIIFKEGNHEERLIRYMSVKAPELLGIAEFEIPSMFGFRQLGVEWIDEKRPHEIRQAEYHPRA